MISSVVFLSTILEINEFKIITLITTQYNELRGVLQKKY